MPKKAAAARWEKRLNKNKKCSSNAHALPKQTKSNAPSPSPNPKDIIADTAVEEIISHLNAKTGKSFRPVGANAKFISARLKSGATVEQCKAVIDKKSAEWLGDEKMQEYLRPETLFNPTKFESYLASATRKVSYAPIN